MEQHNDYDELIRLGRQRYWYQQINVDGRSTPVSNQAMADTVFYNKGKWNHFIRPLFPFAAEGKIMVEFGCNAGLFLLLAAESGFREVYGLEGDDGYYNHARFILDHYRQRSPELYGRIHLMHERIGLAGKGANANCTIQSSCKPMQWSDLPPADVTLLANVLYWIDRESAMRYIQELAEHSAFCIVVSVNRACERGGPCALEDIRCAFTGQWEEIRCISHPQLKEGEKGRDMFSILFRSRTFPASPDNGFSG